MDEMFYRVLVVEGVKQILIAMQQAF